MPANSTITPEQNMQALNAAQKIRDGKTPTNPIRNRITTILLIIAVLAVIGIGIYIWVISPDMAQREALIPMLESMIL